MCVHGREYIRMYVEVRRQLAGVVLPPTVWILGIELTSVSPLSHPISPTFLSFSVGK